MMKKIEITLVIILFILYGISCAKTPNRLEKTTQKHFDDAIEYFDGGELNAAAAELQQAISKDPDFIEVYIMLGRIYLEMGDKGSRDRYIQSVEALMIAKGKLEEGKQPRVGQTPEDLLQQVNENLFHATDRMKYKFTAREFFDVTRGYFDAGKLALAAFYCQNAIEKEPEFIEAYINLGAIYSLMGDKTRQKEYYEKAIKALISAREKLEAGQTPKLNGHTKEALRQRIRYNLSYAFYRIGKYEDALLNIKNFLDMQPENEKATRRLGLIEKRQELRKRGIDAIKRFDWQEAVLSFEQAMDKLDGDLENPCDYITEAWKDAAEAFSNGKWQLVIDKHPTMIENEIDSTVAQNLLDMAKAGKAGEKALAIAQQDMVKKDFEKAISNYEEAIKKFTTVLNNFPNHQMESAKLKEVQLKKAEAYFYRFEKGDCKAAIDALKYADTSNEEVSQLVSLVQIGLQGESYLFVDFDWEKAKSEFDKIFQEHPEHQRVKELRDIAQSGIEEETARKEERWNEAIEEFQKIVDSFPEESLKELKKVLEEKRDASVKTDEGRTINEEIKRIEESLEN